MFRITTRVQLRQTKRCATYENRKYSSLLSRGKIEISCLSGLPEEVGVSVLSIGVCQYVHQINTLHWYIKYAALLLCIKVINENKQCFKQLVYLISYLSVYCLYCLAVGRPSEWHFYRRFLSGFVTVINSFDVYLRDSSNKNTKKQ